MKQCRQNPENSPIVTADSSINHINTPPVEAQQSSEISMSNKSSVSLIKVSVTGKLKERESLEKIQHIEAQMESPGYYIPRVPQEPRDKVLDLGLPDKLYVADDILITQEESIYNSVVTVSPRDFNYAAMSEFFAKATVIKPNGSSITSSRDGNNAREEGSGDISEANPCNGTKTGPKKTENVCKTPKNWSSEYWDKVSRGQMRSSSRLTNFQNQTKSATEFTIRVASSSPLVSPSSTEPERRVWGFMRPTESSKRKSRN